MTMPLTPPNLDDRQFADIVAEAARRKRAGQVVAGFAAETDNIVENATAKLADKGTLWQMAPSKIDAVVALGKTPEVTVDEHPLGAAPETIDTPPFSISIYSYPLQ